MIAGVSNNLSTKQTVENYTSIYKIFTESTVGLAKLIFSPINSIFPINPVTQFKEIKLVPVWAEKLCGQLLFPTTIQNAGGEIFETDTKYGHYAKMVKEIGDKLIEVCPRQDLKFEFKLVSNLRNATCLPGGKVVIGLNLIKEMERDTSDYGLGFTPTIQEKIAAVLSHEIIHAAARHTAKKIERKCLTSLFIGSLCAIYVLKTYRDSKRDLSCDPRNVPFDFGGYIEAFKKKLAYATYPLAVVFLASSRNNELESDAHGMRLLQKIQGDNFNKNSPQALIWFTYHLKNHFSKNTGLGLWDKLVSLQSTHPTPEQRIAANRKTWETLNSSSDSTQKG